MAAAFLTGKVIALTLGTNGVGIQAVVTGTGSLTAILATWGFANALPTLVSANPNSGALDFSRSISQAASVAFPFVFGLAALAVVPELLHSYLFVVVVGGLLMSAVAAILLTVRPTMLAVFSGSRSAANNQLVGAAVASIATLLAVLFLPPGALPMSVGGGLLLGQVSAWVWSRRERSCWRAERPVPVTALIRTTWPVFSSVAVSAGALAALPLLVLHISGSSEVGLLRAAMSLGAIPVAVMTSGVALHFYPGVAEAIRQDQETSAITGSSVRHVVRPAVGLSLAVAAFAPFLLWLAYSRAFVVATPILVFVVATAPLQLLAFHNAYLLLAYGRRHAYFLSEVVAATALLGLVAFGAWIGKGWMVGSALWVTYFLHLIVTRRMLRGSPDVGISAAQLGKKYVLGIALMPAIALAYAILGARFD